MSTSEKVVEVEFLDMVHHDGRKKSIGSPSDQNDDTWFNLAGVKQIIKEYILNEPDVARVSNESETFVLIEEKTDDQTQSEQPIVEEEIVTTKVSSEESSIHWPGETDDNDQDIVEEKEDRKRSTRTISLTSPEEDMESDKENDPTQTPTRGGSKRLDLGRYQPINAENKTKRSVTTKRLDTSRFSKFQEDSPDSSSNVKVTRNFTVSSTPRKLNIEKPTPMTTPNSDHCVVCKKTVYPMEKITADDVVYHKTCFRCRECNRQLSLGNFAQSKQFLYCKPHFKQLFQLKGNYDDAFDGTSRAMRASGFPDTENGIDQVDGQEVREEDAAQFEGTKSLKDQFEKGAVSNVTVKKSFDPVDVSRTNESGDSYTPEKMVSENEPVLRPDVVRASDVIDDHMAISGMKSLRDQFERGEGNVSTSAKSVNVQEEIRAAKESEVEASYGQVAESTPVRNEDVVRSDVQGEEVKTSSGGIRSLKDRFEKGKVSNIDVTPVKPVIDIHPLEEYDSGNFDKGVSESTPVVRDDVVKSSEKVEDSFISTGGARSLKARFEKGNVSNIEEKSKEKIEMTPGKLEDYDDGGDGADGGVSESTPIQRDDVVKEGKGDEDPGIKTGAARNLKNLFEKGEVHNIEEKPRPVLERSPKSLDQLEPSSDGVVESTPEVRTDIVRETSTRDEPMNIEIGVSRSLKDRWEKGEVETAPAKPKEVVDIRAEFEGQGQVAESKPEVREDLVRESTEVQEAVSPGAGSLRAQWEAGEVVGAEVRIQKEELSPKRLSAYYDGEPEGTGEEEIVSEQLVEVATEEMVKEQMEELEETTRNDDFVEEQDALPAKDELEVSNEHQEVDLQEEQVVNGHAEENGLEGEYTSEPAEDTLISFEAAPGQDIASWEIKAARSGALQSQDGGDDIINETANEDTAIEGNDSGLLIDIGDGDVNVTVGDDEMLHD